MRYLILSDLHANWEALQAVLEDSAGQYDKPLCCGDLIGYGARNLNNAGCYNLPSNPGSATGGSPSASGCASPTRYIQEVLAGFTYRFVNSPKIGRLQYAVNWQMIQRNLWSGLGSATTPTGPRGVDNMIFTGFRYYIP